MLAHKAEEGGACSRKNCWSAWTCQFQYHPVGHLLTSGNCLGQVKRKSNSRLQVIGYSLAHFRFLANIISRARTRRYDQYGQNAGGCHTDEILGGTVGLWQAGDRRMRAMGFGPVVRTSLVSVMLIHR
jgi:hypothetical protein